MAKRYIYFVNKKNHYNKQLFSFQWFSGFSVSQYRKSSISLINSFHQKYPKLKILEVSSASSKNLGIQASALNLTITSKKGINYSVEQLFQAGKVFEKAGSQLNLLKFNSRELKKKIKIISKNDKLIGFNLFNHSFPLEPKTFFYNWLYIHALQQNKNIAQQILKYDAFSDIYFNPQRSINSQAEACARFVSLSRQNLLLVALNDFNSFKHYVYKV